MTSPSRARFDLSSLRDPRWWGALALLLVNDNLLKGGGIVPGWLTGKLSDFAFLIVAPVLFAVLLPRALPRRRTLALLSVVGLYVAADLSRTVSDSVVAVAARLGLVWRLWPDPTDLVALVVLPLTLRMMRGRSEGAARATGLLRERAGVVLGAVACLATSSVGYPLQTEQPFLLNAAPASASVRVTWVLRPVTCDAPETLAATLNPSDLDDPLDLSLERGQVVALDGPRSAGVSPVGICSTGGSSTSQDRDCLAVIVESSPASPVLMVAPRFLLGGGGAASSGCGSPTPPPSSRCQPTLNPTMDAGPDALTLKEVGGTLAFVVGANLKIVPVDPAAIAVRPSAAEGCRVIRDAYRALLASPTCGSNADCVGMAGVPIPGAPSSCDIDVNVGSLPMLDELRRKWTAACVSGGEGVSCRVPQPAVCRGGTCGPACPGVTPPLCPALCGYQAGNGCGGDTVHCRREDGTFCSCVNNRVACAPQPAISPDCPLVCLDWAGGDLVVAGGASQDGSARSGDGGATDAGTGD